MKWLTMKNSVQCPCNTTNDAALLDSQIFSACAPIITAAMRTGCGLKRLLASVITLLILLIVLYYVFLSHNNTMELRRMRTEALRTGNPQEIETAQLG